MIIILKSKNYLTNRQDISISISEIPFTTECFGTNEVRLYLTQEQADELADKIQKTIQEIEAK